MLVRISDAYSTRHTAHSTHTGWRSFLRLLSLLSLLFDVPPEGIRAKGEVLYVLRGGLFWIQVIQDEHLQTKGGQKGGQKGGKKERRKEGKKDAFTYMSNDGFSIGRTNIFKERWQK